MKSSDRFARCRHKRTDATRRARLLAAFDRSGLSAVAFARQHGLNYTTFCGWRQRRVKTKRSPGFVQVELPTPTVPAQTPFDRRPSARRTGCFSGPKKRARAVR